MKNINYYKTPMDKALAFRAWLESQELSGFNPTMRVEVSVGVTSSDAKVILFNAWLHSNVADTQVVE